MPLSAPVGPYGVSTLTLELPVRSPTVFSAHFKLHSQPVLSLRTVLLTLYYPADAAPSRPAASGGDLWLNAPRLRSVEGLLKYAGISRHLAIPAVVPAYSVFSARLPVAQSAPLLQGGPERLPVAVFSHGLGGTRNTYSQYLSTLAAHGVVVASVEHRDLSGPSTTVCTRDASGVWSSTTHVYHRHGELDAAPGGANGDDRPETGASADTPADEWAWRRAQLRLRAAEVREAAWVLSQLEAGQAAAHLASASTRLPDGSPTAAPDARCMAATTEVLERFAGKLDVARTWGVGHSFGAATMLETLQRDEAPPFCAAVLLDPWLEPLTRGARVVPRDSAGVSSSAAAPLYVLNSDAFTVWKDHFADLKARVRRAKLASGAGWLWTTTGTKHTDFSDFPFVLPRMFASKLSSAQAGVDIFAHATLGAMRGGDGDGGDALGYVRTALPDLSVREEREGEVDARDLGQEVGVLVLHTV